MNTEPAFRTHSRSASESTVRCSGASRFVISRAPRSSAQQRQCHSSQSTRAQSHSFSPRRSSPPRPPLCASVPLRRYEYRTAPRDRAPPAPPGQTQSPRIPRSLVHNNLRRPRQHVDAAIKRHQLFRRRHIQVSRPNNLVHARQALRAVGKRRNRLRSADPGRTRQRPASMRLPASPAPAAATPPQSSSRPPPAPESPSSAASRAADSVRSAHSIRTESSGAHHLPRLQPRHR